VHLHFVTHVIQSKSLMYTLLRQVGHQLTVIQQQLARDDIDEWERDILMSEWDLLNKVKHNETPKT